MYQGENTYLLWLIIKPSNIPGLLKLSFYINSLDRHFCKTWDSGVHEDSISVSVLFSSLPIEAFQWPITSSVTLTF